MDSETNLYLKSRVVLIPMMIHYAIQGGYFIMLSKEKPNEEISYTESALSDRFKEFFNTFKNIDGKYFYVNTIDELINTKHIVEINFDDFTEEIKNICNTETKSRVHIAIYRGIGEVFQNRHNSAELDIFIRNNYIKFKIYNLDKFKDITFEDPSLIYWDNDEDGKYAGEDKIDQVAKRLQKQNTFVTLRKTEELLLYNGKIYDNLQAETLIKEETEKLIPNCTKHHTLEVIDKIKRQTYSDLENFDVDSNLITVNNGILNLQTLELIPHTPKHLSRVLLPVEYHKPTHDSIEDNLRGTLFWKYLTASFTVDGKFREDDFNTILEIISSPIIKRHIDEKAFMFLGGGENGKSVCLGYIHSILGKDNVTAISLQDIAEDKYMMANLDGISANIFPDLEQHELRHTGKIKAITSNESIQVQKKHQQPFKLYPFCKLLFSCNRFPKVYDQSQGFFRRWIIIKWERDFENDPARIEYLREKLDENQEEKNLVFSCLVNIANKLNNTGKFTHSKDWKTIQKEWNENADPIDAFDSEYIIDSTTFRTKRETYQFYKKIILNKGESPLGLGQFGKAFAEYHDEDRIKKDGITERVWLNIDFREPKQTTFNDSNNDSGDTK